MISGASLAHWVEGCNAVAEFCLRISPELFAGCLTAFLSTGSGSGLQQVSYQSKGWWIDFWILQSILTTELSPMHPSYSECEFAYR